MNIVEAYAVVSQHLANETGAGGDWSWWAGPDGEAFRLVVRHGNRLSQRQLDSLDGIDLLPENRRDTYAALTGYTG